MNNQVLVCGTGAYAQALTYFMLKSGCDVNVYVGDPRWAIKFDQWWAKPPFTNLKLRTHQLQVNVDLEKMNTVQFLILAVPSQLVDKWVKEIMVVLPARPVWILVSKGLYNGLPQNVNCLVEFVQKTLTSDCCRGVAAVYGPSVASDVLAGCATTFLVAALPKSIQLEVKRLFEQNYCRTRVTDNLYGAELAFAMKNVFGIAGGIWATLSSVTNSERCALFGLAYRELLQMFRFFGLDTKLLWEPAFMGDFMLAITSSASRNFRLGVSLVDHQLLPSQTIEGKTSLATIYQRLAPHNQLGKFPLISHLYQVVFAHQPVTSLVFKTVFNQNFC